MNSSKINLQLQQQIDACRASTQGESTTAMPSDLALPGLELLAGSLAVEQDRNDNDDSLAAALRQSMAFDRTMIAAFQDVQPPAGLADRLLANVLQQSGDVAESAALPAAEAVSTPAKKPAEALPQATTPRTNRRAAIAVLGCSLAAAAALMLVAVLPSPTLSRNEFMAMVDDDWIDRSLANDEESWRDFTASTPASSRPSTSMVHARALHWRAFRSSLDPAGVEYDLRTSRTSRKAILYVVQTRTVIHNLPTAPSRRPQSQTGGWVVSSWREGDLVYVLAVEGDAARYRSLIRLPQFS